MSKPIQVQLHPKARFRDYLGVWCIEETAGNTLRTLANNMDWQRHNAEYDDEDGNGVKTCREKNIAVVSIAGVMQKHAGSMDDATSTVMVRSQLRDLATDTSVDAVMLHIDSPGGTSAGTAELASEVARLNEAKPVHVFAEDLMASAAYWVGSQADHISANTGTALVGSIGTMMVVHDLSRAAENAGVEVVVLKTGDLKATGTPGAPVTDQQRVYLQEIIDKTQVAFDAAVMEGRGFNEQQLDKVRSGRVWTATDALSLGLIDSIESFDAAMDRLREAVTARQQAQKTEARQMANERLAELRQACPGADSDFLLKQVEQDAEISAAQAEWISTLQSRLEASNEKAEALKSNIESLKAEHAEAIEALESKLAEAEAKAEQIKIGASIEETPDASNEGDGGKARSLADVVRINREPSRN